MNWDEFHNNVIGWATDRGIIPNATPDAQMGKVLEEIAETWQAIIAKDEAEIKDGIGDVAVTLVIHAELSNDTVDFDGWTINPPCSLVNNDYALYHLGQSATLALGCDQTEALTELVECCAIGGYDFMECCQLAWNEIKDRKGYLDDQGVFHKESK